jgi:hypothetical protein
MIHKGLWTGMNKNSTLDERISAFAAKLWIAGIPLGLACEAAEQVLAPQLPGYKERRCGGLHHPCGDDEGLYFDDSSLWDGLDDA